MDSLAIPKLRGFLLYIILFMSYLPWNYDSFPFQIQLYSPSLVLASVTEIQANLVSCFDSCIFTFYCIYHLQHVALESTFPSIHPSSHSNVGLSIPFAKPCIEVIIWLWYLPLSNLALSSPSTFPYTIHYDLVFLSYISRWSNLRQHQQVNISAAVVPTYTMETDFVRFL